MPYPQVGTIKSKYGKTRVYQGYCKTCEPEWRGPMESRENISFTQAVLHAIQVHKWIPPVNV